MYTELLSQEIAIPQGASATASTIFPQSFAASGTASTGWIDLGFFPQVEFRVDVGAVTSGGSISFGLYGSSAASGSGTAITGTSITVITTSSNSATVLITAEKLAALGLGYRYVKGTITNAGTAAVLAAVTVRAKDQRFDPATNFADSSVVQQILLFR